MWAYQIEKFLLYYLIKEHAAVKAFLFQGKIGGRLNARIMPNVSKKGESLISFQPQQEDGIDVDNDEDDDSHMSDDDDNRFSFATSSPIDDTTVENNSSYDELKIQDNTTASHESLTKVQDWFD